MDVQIIFVLRVSRHGVLAQRIHLTPPHYHFTSIACYCQCEVSCHAVHVTSHIQITLYATDTNTSHERQLSRRDALGCRLTCSTRHEQLFLDAKL